MSEAGISPPLAAEYGWESYPAVPTRSAGASPRANKHPAAARRENELMEQMHKDGR